MQCAFWYLHARYHGNDGELLVPTGNSFLRLADFCSENRVAVRFHVFTTLAQGLNHLIAAANHLDDLWISEFDKARVISRGERRAVFCSEFANLLCLRVSIGELSANCDGYECDGCTIFHGMWWRSRPYGCGRRVSERAPR